MEHVKQSTFKFNLEDKVVITSPNEKSISLKGLAGRVTHRGYMDTVSPRDMVYPNLYAIYVPKEGLIPGIPQHWIEHDTSEEPPEYPEQERGIA